MSLLVAVLLAMAAQDPIVIRTVESPAATSFPAFELRDGEAGVALGADADVAELLGAAGFSTVPGTREIAGKKIAFIADPKDSAAGDLVVLVTALPRDQAAAALRANPRIGLCVVTGRGGGDPEPLKVGDAWMVQAGGSTGLWGRIEVRPGVVTHRFGPPDGKASEKVAELRRKRGSIAAAGSILREGAKPVPAAEAAPALETSNRACRLRIFSVVERSSYGTRMPSPGRKLLVLDAEFENTIPMTLVQSNQVPTMYRIKEMGDHLYVVVNGNRAARILPDGGQLPGHVVTSAFTLDRLGTRIRGNLIYEVPAEGVESLDLRFYDYAHGHMTLVLRGTPKRDEKPVVAAEKNEVLEAGVYQAERLKEAAGKKAPEGMTYLAVELRAVSQLFTESDATAFDPKAKPGDKIQVGTVSDWKDARRHFHALVDGEYAYPSLDGAELGEAPRFLPDLPTGGGALFLVPEKAGSVEIRCDFPNAKLPDGRLVHPKALSFLVEGKRPALPERPAILAIDDEVFKVSITAQSVAAEFAGTKAPAGSAFLVLDMTVVGAGTAGDLFQTSEQLHYATEKGAQVPLHEVTWKGLKAPTKLLLVPTNERRSFQAVFQVPATDRKPRLAYKGVSKAAILELKPIDGGAEAARACPKCKRAAEPGEKFCADCGTPIPK